MPGTVFINYRREDTAQAAGRIYDRLVQAYGRETIFMDIDKIPYGSDFTEHIQNQFDDCKVVIALIGRRWLTARSGIWPFSSRRIESAADWVRKEIEIALRKSVTIIPVLVDGATMPPIDKLPSTISAITSRNALGIRHENFRTDAELLINSVGALIAVTPRAPNKYGIELVSCDVTDHETDAGLQSKMTLVLKNTGTQSLVLQEGEFAVSGKATMQDCMQPRYSLMTCSWTYDVDIEGDRTFKGKHYLKPNEVETFDVLIGRKRGGPTLTVYRARLSLKFDKDEANITTGDLYLRVTGPVTIAGMFRPGVTPEDFCRCMKSNIEAFDVIGYDLRKSIDPSTLEMLKKFETGNSLDEYK